MVKATSRVDKFSKSDVIVSPSILSANFAKLGEQVQFSILIFTTTLLFVFLWIHWIICTCLNIYPATLFFIS